MSHALETSSLLLDSRIIYPIFLLTICKVDFVSAGLCSKYNVKNNDNECYITVVNS